MASSVRGGGRGGGAGAEETAPLPLPPPPRLVAAMSSSSPASIRALLSRTGGGGAADCQQSPRSLLSRILLRGGDHHGGNGGGGGGGTFGCRVRLPRRYSSTSSASSVRKDDGSLVSEQSSDDVGGAARVKVVERAPELPVDTPRSSLGSGRKKPEEELMSMNLGLGASLVLLLSKSAVELNRMVELRAQMEALASEMRQMAPLGSEKQGAAAPAAASSTTSSQESTVIKDPIAAEDALSDNCSGARTADRRAVAVMDHSQMEAELQVELGRLQMQHRAVHVEKRAIAPPMQGLELPPLHVKTKNHVAADSPSRSCVDDGGEGDVVAQEEEEEDDEEEEYDDEDDDDLSEGHGAVVDGNSSPPHGGVSARALERRLHELLQRRQQDRIVQLEAALDGAQRKLQEREREVVWWRDAAKLVSHRRDESRRLRCTAAS